LLIKLSIGVTIFRSLILKQAPWKRAISDGSLQKMVTHENPKVATTGGRQFFIRFFLIIKKAKQKTCAILSSCL